MKKPTHGNELAEEFLQKEDILNILKNSATQNKDDEPSDFDILLQISSTANFSYDSLKKVWADFTYNDTRYVSLVSSQDFEDWLRYRFFAVKGKALSDNNLKPVIKLLEARTKFKGIQKETFVRFGQNHEGVHFLDLGDKTVRISKSGWSIINNDPEIVPKFYRPNGFQKIPHPVKNGNHQLLRKWVNVESETDFRLLISWLLAAMNPSIPTPILILQGEQGTAKSTTAKVLRSLIDPNGSPLRQCPKEVRDLYISALYSGVIVWDNLSGLQYWASDALCRICTGSGFSTRVLYTNTDEIIIQLQRPIILNGIDAIATRGDLLDRSIVLSLPYIDSESRVDETTFWESFNNDVPLIIGALLDAYVAGLNSIDNIDLKHLPRMADYAKWVTACEKSFGFEEGTFISDFNENQQNAVELTMSNDPVAIILLELLKETDSLKFSAIDLISQFELKAIEMDIGNKTPTTKTLKNNLDRLSPLLRRLNIHWESNRSDAGMIYRIWKST